MPIPNHNRLRIEVGGDISGSPWATGLVISPQGTDSPTVTELDDSLTVIKGYFTTFFSGEWRNLNQPSTRVTDIKAYWYEGANGAASVTAEQSMNVVGAGGGLSGPASQAMVVTLLTERAGKSGRGRMYLPATAGLPGGADSYKFALSQCSNVANQAADLLGSIYTEAGQPWGVSWPSVQSNTLGVLSAITRVRVDQRPDRIEHRERGLAFSAVAVGVGD